MTTTIDPRQRVASNNKQQARLAYKRREVLRLAAACRNEVESYGVKLPRTYVDYQDAKEKILAEAGYEITTEFIENWDRHHNEIIKMQYTLRRTNKAVYALFENKNKVVKPMLVSMWYTKHRMDEVWLMRKSQLIRSIYRDYLQTAMVAPDKLLIKTYTPAHLVLTLPHDASGYGGDRFYLKKLLQLFHELRRSKEWKQCVYGGEYGAEIKKSSNGNGLHIHIHSLIFLNECRSINAFRNWIRQRWAKITGTNGRSFIHLEQLFTYKRDESGAIIREPGRARNQATGEYEDLYDITFDEDDTAIVQPKMVRKKHYIGPDSSIEDYLAGVMECIKYHFKSDTYKLDDNSFDIDLIRDILNNSKNVRFYSRYGAFYRCKELNFDRYGDDDTDEAPIEENIEKDLNGSAARGIQNLINPFTFEPAADGEYDLAIASPEHLKYASGKDISPHHLMQYGTDEFTRVAKGVEINEVIRSMILGKLAPILIKEDRKVAWYDRRTTALNTT